MATLDAAVVSQDDKYFIKIKAEDGDITIPLSDDNANAVKSAFNKLIQRIRTGEFTIKLDKVGEDLFSMVANEYLTQLNREIHEVRSQMKEYSLFNPDEGTQRP